MEIKLDATVFLVASRTVNASFGQTKAVLIIFAFPASLHPLVTVGGQEQRCRAVIALRTKRLMSPALNLSRRTIASSAVSTALLRLSLATRFAYSLRMVEIRRPEL
ncbi:hypothetical protein RRG08_038138 [Elysia crispata]|uniref:Uncharacterized protein n=1 Tax=Elysia crispata TaxID=231223 RepID=A0AAE0ZZ26_9GAST|nr:hypothetical protein RRG08_038138 [Elysia crispata]